MIKNLVSPSILSCDFLNIEHELKPLLNVKEMWIHLDIMDGHFVPNLTFGIPIISKLCKKIDLPMDAHLMVNNPEFHIEEMKDFGLSNITFHFEATQDSLGLIKKAKENYPSVGISIKPKTNISDLSSEILKEADLILVMSVEPGFGGQSFIPETLQKIKDLHDLRIKNGYHYQIQIDGGVTNQNAQELRSLGADNLVAGSYVFKAEPTQYADRVNSLR